MFAGKTVLAVIAARGGSKGLPGKNLRLVAGKPLIYWSILEAQKSKLIDRLIVSSEDNEILAVARSFGAETPFVRPESLAADDTPGVAPVLHALEALPGYDYVVLLQPTSPLRTVEDIDGSIGEAINKQSKSVVTISEPEKLPNWMCTLDENGRLSFLLGQSENTERRQDAKKIYALNGAVFVADCNWLVKSQRLDCEESIGFEMPKERSIDVDDEMDLKICETLLLERAGVQKNQLVATTICEDRPKL
ncbi:MAG: acylneuraminate cytidylyltransferase family protein [Candidatus Obscuribacterales bacterium]|nr:acylneuraminate cytidylyltransferase family protein [Candidatus Obscuribacterales bacterium]